MTYLRGPRYFRADQVAEVRRALHETQGEFARRFVLSRYAVIRWETTGVKFQYRSQRFEIWHGAVTEAIHQTILRSEEGTQHEQTKNLRQLRALSAEPAAN